MKRFLAAALLLGAFCWPVLAGPPSSAYTDLDIDRDCTVFAMAEEGEGEWANLVCNGYRGYPVFLYSGDLRETAFYGFTHTGDLQPAWESFSAFNSVGPKIEWRLETIGDRSVPFATIHRRTVTQDDQPSGKLEVLVVSKVGQVGTRDGCVVGLVLATGHPEANETAPTIADERARDFACGSEKPVSMGEPMPAFRRNE